LNRRHVVLFGLVLLLPMLMANRCAQFEVADPSYEIGEAGVLIIRNPSPLPMAIGGCNPVFYEERLPGRWVGDGFLRLACAFFTSLDGEHELQAPRIIPPHGEIEVGFPTDWLSSSPGIMRVRQRVSLGCTPTNSNPRWPDEVTCRRVEVIVTDPIVVFEPGTTETVGRRPPGLNPPFTIELEPQYTDAR
jgi:hypothetical protein